MHINDSHIHPVGYAHSVKKYLLPSKNIVRKQKNWYDYLFKRLKNSTTLPADYREQIALCVTSKFKVGLKVEAFDINRVSSVRVAKIVKIIGTRLRIAYQSSKELDQRNSFWCDEKSSLIHPIGWAQLVGHEMTSSSKYAIDSLAKIKNGKWNKDDANFECFPRLYQLMKEYDNRQNNQFKFLKGMRLEVVDALNQKFVI